MSEPIDHHLAFEVEDALAGQPPADIGAEQAVLGSMIQNRGVIDAVASIIGAEDFYRHGHGTIFTAIIDRHLKGEAVDQITLSAELERRGQLTGCGGAPYLFTLTQATPLSANARFYAEIVQEKSQRRRLAASGLRLAQQAAESTRPLDELLEEHNSTVGAIEGGADQSMFDLEVSRAAHKMRVTREARRLLDGDGRAPKPSAVRLDNLLAEPDEHAEYLVDSVFPTGGRVLFSAQSKAGKSTAMANLLRSLVDGDDFLGTYPVAPPTGNIVVIDNELDRRMIRKWLRDQGIQNQDRVHIIPLRGAVSSFDLTDSQVLAGWVEDLAALNPSVIVLDCLRPVLDAIGLDENTEAGRFLVKFDELVAGCGATEAAVVHHFGHGTERARGASRLQDWPDAIWSLLRQNPDDLSSPRFFKAYGRDVDVPEQQIDYDPETRRITVVGGSRQEVSAAGALPAIIELLRDSPESLSKAIVEERLKGVETQKSIREAIKLGIASGDITETPGERGARLLSVSSSARCTSLQARQRGQTSSSSGRPLGGVQRARSTSWNSSQLVDLEPDELGSDSEPTPEELNWKRSGKPVRETRNGDGGQR